jgi:4a-hydroxytetrahydrobiopterin dehydratase
MQELNPAEIKKNLDELYGWFYINNAIEKEFFLKTFTDAIAFVVKVGIEAERIEHHPTLLLHSWNKVKISLTTHDAGNVTDLDFKLAKQIDEIRK